MIRDVPTFLDLPKGRNEVCNQDMKYIHII